MQKGACHPVCDTVCAVLGHLPLCLRVCCDRARGLQSAATWQFVCDTGFRSKNWFQNLKQGEGLNEIGIPEFPEFRNSGILTFFPKFSAHQRVTIRVWITRVWYCFVITLGPLEIECDFQNSDECHTALPPHHTTLPLLLLLPQQSI